MNHEDRNEAVVAESVASMRTLSVAGVNTTTNQMDWLIPAPKSGYRIAIWGWTGGVVTSAASTAVLTILTGGTTVATNTTTISYWVTAAPTVTAVYRVPLVSEVQPSYSVPIAIGASGKSVHIHAVITSATAGTIAVTYSLIPSLGPVNA